MPFIASRGRVRSNEPDLTININEPSKSMFILINYVSVFLHNIYIHLLLS